MSFQLTISVWLSFDVGSLNDYDKHKTTTTSKTIKATNTLESVAIARNPLPETPESGTKETSANGMITC